MASFLVFWTVLWLLVFLTWGLWRFSDWTTRERLKVEKPPASPQQEDPWQAAKRAYQEAMRQIDNSPLELEEKQAAKDAAREKYGREVSRIMEMR